MAYHKRTEQEKARIKAEKSKQGQLKPSQQNKKGQGNGDKK